jgi:pimeloyl-ACP methyl ester carboxylesterase
MPYVNHAGPNIYWEARGTGDPILLIMELGVSLEGWNRVGPALAARCRTILSDNRGVGRSEVPPGRVRFPGWPPTGRLFSPRRTSSALTSSASQWEE